MISINVIMIAISIKMKKKITKFIKSKKLVMIKSSAKLNIN
jgi:hypothetical protein